MKIRQLKLHFEPMSRGILYAFKEGEPLEANFEIGLVEGGRSRVYEGLYVRIRCLDFGEWLGLDRWSYQAALREAALSARNAGFDIHCAGLSPLWYETGLSAGSGYGYFKGYEQEGPLLVCDPLPKSYSRARAR